MKRSSYVTILANDKSILFQNVWVKGFLEIINNIFEDEFFEFLNFLTFRSDFLE